ncbi:hypothetical protein [Fibrella arboris]|uniref:hypothetical protein n=1 Tax=Fibrella arboris TaxID=3242486 RepID=UPI00351FF71C
MNVYAGNEHTKLFTDRIENIFVQTFAETFAFNTILTKITGGPGTVWLPAPTACLANGETISVPNQK